MFKKITTLLICFLFIVTNALPAFAAETQSEAPLPAETQDEEIKEENTQKPEEEVTPVQEPSDTQNTERAAGTRGTSRTRNKTCHR